MPQLVTHAHICEETKHILAILTCLPKAPGVWYVQGPGELRPQYVFMSSSSNQTCKGWEPLLLLWNGPCSEIGPARLFCFPAARAAFDVTVIYSCVFPHQHESRGEEERARVITGI